MHDTQGIKAAAHHWHIRHACHGKPGRCAVLSAACMQCRASELQCELEGQTVQLHQAQSGLDKLQHSLSERDLELSTAKSAGDSAQKEAWALQGQLKAHAEPAAKVYT